MSAEHTELRATLVPSFQSVTQIDAARAQAPPQGIDPTPFSGIQNNRSGLLMRAIGNAESRLSDEKVPLCVSESDAIRHPHANSFRRGRTVSSRFGSRFGS